MSICAINAGHCASFNVAGVAFESYQLAFSTTNR